MEPFRLESSSSMSGSGKASITALLGSHKSDHIRILPDYLCVGDTHVEASIGSITPAASRHFSSPETTALTDCGSLWRTDTMESTFPQCRRFLAQAIAGAVVLEQGNTAIEAGTQLATTNDKTAAVSYRRCQEI